MSQGLDVNALLQALKNTNNENLMNTDSDKITEMKEKMLKALNLDKPLYEELLKKLEHYRYIDELPDLNFGSFIRWIPLQDPSKIKLTNGGFVCDIKINNGIDIVCKNKMNRYFQFKMGDSLIFQKLSDQERVLLSAMDFLKT